MNVSSTWPSRTLSPGLSRRGGPAAAVSTLSPFTVVPLVEPASAISVAGLLDRVEAGVVPQGARVVLTVTGHGLKDPQWALRNADGSQVEPTVVDATTSEVASVLDLAPAAATGEARAAATTPVTLPTTSRRPWLVALAAILLLAGGFAVARLTTGPETRDEGTTTGSSASADSTAASRAGTSTDDVATERAR